MNDNCSPVMDILSLILWINQWAYCRTDADSGRARNQ